MDMTGRGRALAALDLREIPPKFTMDKKERAQYNEIMITAIREAEVIVHERELSMPNPDHPAYAATVEKLIDAEEIVKFLKYVHGQSLGNPATLKSMLHKLQNEPGSPDLGVTLATRLTTALGKEALMRGISPSKTEQTPALPSNEMRGSSGGAAAEERGSRPTAEERADAQWSGGFKSMDMLKSGSAAQKGPSDTRLATGSGGKGAEQSGKPKRDDLTWGEARDELLKLRKEGSRGQGGKGDPQGESGGGSGGGGGHGGGSGDAGGDAGRETTRKGRALFGKIVSHASNLGDRKVGALAALPVPYVRTNNLRIIKGLPLTAAGALLGGIIAIFEEIDYAGLVKGEEEIDAMKTEVEKLEKADEVDNEALVEMRAEIKLLEFGRVVLANIEGNAASDAAMSLISSCQSKELNEAGIISVFARARAGDPPTNTGAVVSYIARISPLLMGNQEFVSGVKNDIFATYHTAASSIGSCAGVAKANFPIASFITPGQMDLLNKAIDSPWDHNIYDAISDRTKVILGIVLQCLGKYPRDGIWFFKKASQSYSQVLIDAMELLIKDSMQKRIDEVIGRKSVLSGALMEDAHKLWLSAGGVDLELGEPASSYGSGDEGDEGEGWGDDGGLGGGETGRAVMGSV